MAKRLTIFAACHGEVLAHVLKSVYPDAFEYQCLPSYRVLLGETLPESLWDAEIFVYQPFLNPAAAEDRKQYETRRMVQFFRQKGVPCFGFPYLHFEGYHPDHCHDPLNDKTKSPTVPWGLFPYGLGQVMKLRGQMPAAEITAASKADDFLTADYIESRMQASAAIARQKEQEADIQITDWILRNFRKQQLFHAVNHPSNAMMQEVFDPVFDFLGLPRINLAESPEFLGPHRPPIYPCVHKAMGLEFASQPAINHVPTTYDEYMNRYLSL